MFVSRIAQECSSLDEPPSRSRSGVFIARNRGSSRNLRHFDGPPCGSPRNVCHSRRRPPDRPGPCRRAPCGSPRNLRHSTGRPRGIAQEHSLPGTADRPGTSVTSTGRLRSPSSFDAPPRVSPRNLCRSTSHFAYRPGPSSPGGAPRTLHLLGELSPGSRRHLRRSEHSTFFGVGYQENSEFLRRAEEVYSLASRIAQECSSLDASPSGSPGPLSQDAPSPGLPGPLS